MNISNSLGVTVLLACAGASACSDPPAPTVIIVREAPATGGQASTSTGGAAPITFMGSSGNANMASTSTASSGGAPGTSPSSQPTASGAAGSNGAAGAPASGLPCDVATYLAAKCTSCHGRPPLPSALAALVSYDDLKAPSKEDPTKNEAELSVARMKNAASPMPPAALPSSADVAILESWIAAGYPMGSCGGMSGDDAGSPPPARPGVFDGAPAFQARTGPRAHNAGRDCMSCHRTGADEAPRFSFGGTLYDPSGNAVAGAEVRLVDANGKATSVYTGTNGTFYGQGTGFAAPAEVGVRNASGAADMISALQASNGGACSSCHCTGGSCTVPPIHLP